LATINALPSFLFSFPLQNTGAYASLPSGNRLGFNQRTFIYPNSIAALRPDQVLFIKSVGGVKHNPCFQEAYNNANLYNRFFCYYTKQNSLVPPASGYFGANVEDAVANYRQDLPNYYQYNTCQYVPLYVYKLNRITYESITSRERFMCERYDYPYLSNANTILLYNRLSYQAIDDCQRIVFNANLADWDVVPPASYNIDTVDVNTFLLRCESMNIYGPDARRAELVGKFNAAKAWGDAFNSAVCPDHKTVCHGAKFCDFSR
jgi:hypothetical protein